MACWVHAALLITPRCCFPCHLRSESWELMYAAVVSELIKQGLVASRKASHSTIGKSLQGRMWHHIFTLEYRGLSSVNLTQYTVACESLGTPCRICENVNNFNKIREIIQNACYFLFSTVLSKTFT